MQASMVGYLGFKFLRGLQYFWAQVSERSASKKGILHSTRVEHRPDTKPSALHILNPKTCNHTGNGSESRGPAGKLALRTRHLRGSNLLISNIGNPRTPNLAPFRTHSLKPEQQNPFGAWDVCVEI